MRAAWCKIRSVMPSLNTFALVTFVTAVNTLAQAKGPVGVTDRVPRFDDFIVTDTFTGTPASPQLVTHDQRLFRTRIVAGVSKGQGVIADTESERPIERPGPNFAGHYTAIIWGCGSQCVMMAIVDDTTGKVFSPPLADKDSLWVPLDNLSEMEMGFLPRSSLMILRNACRDFKNRTSCGTYYFNWKNDRFSLVNFVMVDPR